MRIYLLAFLLTGCGVAALTVEIPDPAIDALDAGPCGAEGKRCCAPSESPIPCVGAALCDVDAGSCVK